MSHAENEQYKARPRGHCHPHLCVLPRAASSSAQDSYSNSGDLKDIHSLSHQILTSGPVHTHVFSLFFPNTGESISLLCHLCFGFSRAGSQVGPQLPG